MTRPEIIRADSIDLQDQVAPSAKDHTLLNGNLGAHQASTLREVAAEIEHETHRSPRVSKEWTSSDAQQLQQYADSQLASGVTAKLSGANLQQQDDLAVAQNGGLTGSTAEDADMADGEGDDGLEEDMMDKISSSPSIDDGGYPLSNAWPTRLGSLSHRRSPLRSPSFTQACNESSSPFVETPDHYPLSTSDVPLQDDHSRMSQAEVQYFNHHQSHHIPGEYPSQEEEDFNRFGNLDSQYLTSESDEGNRSMSPFGLEIYLKRHQQQQQGTTNAETLIDNNSDGEAAQAKTHIQHLVVSLSGELDSDEDSDDNDDTIFLAENFRFIDSGWGGECLQESEDIDFEFVYALHTFVATVEGQANATKGDTMVLLDDSNSYWWLVRVVKDSSIGYLPAEHIETPTERLARLNKHRNIDLTSAMLGDQTEKTKNPLKKAIKRRTAKQVTFSAPTYVEASDIDYSTDEEEGDQSYLGQQEQQVETKDEGPADDDNIAIEPLRPRAELREPKVDSPERGEAKASLEPVRTSDEVDEGRLESRSRNGTVRNTDSFFKDDSVETRKITLTPNLLRDDSSTSTRTSNESKELKQRPSLDKLEKDSPAERAKEKKEKKERKEKEKKPGMLSGLFKRKEKRSKSQDDETDELMGGKPPVENARDSPISGKESEEMSRGESQGPPLEVQRSPSKLQKQPRTEMSPMRKTALAPKLSEPQPIVAPERPSTADAAKPPSMRLVQSEICEEDEPRARSLEESTDTLKNVAASGPSKDKSGGTISKMLRSASSSTSEPKEPKPVKAKKAKSRVELDDFDSSPEISPIEQPARAPSAQTQRPIPGSFPDSYISTNIKEAEERLSESPIQISPIDTGPSLLPALMVDTSSQEEPPSPVSSELSPSPELIDADDVKKGVGSSTTSASTPTWSDTHLRTFFDDDGDIKDLLVVVYDKSGVTPAGPDHPVTGNLFKEENAKLAEITNRLDSMLGDYLARKTKTSR